MVDFKNDSNADIQKYIQKQIDDAIKKDREKRKTESTAKERFTKVYEEDAKNLGTISEILNSINKQTDLYRKSLQQLGGEGAFFVKGGPLQEGLEATIKKMDALTASPEAGANAFKQLTVQIKNFAQLAKATEDAQGGLAASLSEQAGILQQLGLSYGSFSKNVDFAIYSMGQNKEAVDGLNVSLVNLSKQIGMLPDDVSRNFQMVAKNLAYDFAQIKEQFVGIQKLSAETGVSIDNLMGRFGQRMDTISGASEMAAKINSLLGTNRFSATELLVMDEEERMTSIRESLMDRGIADQALGGGLRGKFALQSINEVLGLGLDDTRRFLQTGGLKGDIADQVGKDFDGADQRFVQQTDKAADALEEFTDIILRFMKPATEVAIRSRRETMEDPGLLQTLGVIGSTGETGDINRAMINSLAFRDIMFIYRQDKQRAENEFGITEGKLQELARGINAGGSAGLQARRSARELQTQIGSGSGIRGGLSPLQLSIAARAPETGGFKQFLINEMRGTDNNRGFSEDDFNPDGTLTIEGDKKMKAAQAKFEKDRPLPETLEPGGQIIRPNFTYNPTVKVYVGDKELQDIFTEHLEPVDPDAPE